MSEYTNRELIEAIYDVRDRVTRIEEKLNRAEKLEDKVDEQITKTDAAKDIAENALAVANLAREEIASIRANSRWMWGFMISTLLATLAILVDFFKP